MACAVALCISSPASAQYVARESNGTEPRAKLRRFTAKLSAGPTVHALYDRPIYGGDFTVALGANAFKHPGHYYACLRGLIGQTPSGLNLEHVRVCGLFEWSIGPVRLGVTPEIGLLLVHRTTHDNVMGSFSWVSTARCPSISCSSSRTSRRRARSTSR
jgi:hypothetical protein